MRKKIACLWVALLCISLAACAPDQMQRVEATEEAEQGLVVTQPEVVEEEEQPQDEEQERTKNATGMRSEGVRRSKFRQEVRTELFIGGMGIGNPLTVNSVTKAPAEVVKECVDAIIQLDLYTASGCLSDYDEQDRVDLVREFESELRIDSMLAAFSRIVTQADYRIVEEDIYHKELAAVDLIITAPSLEIFQSAILADLQQRQQAQGDADDYLDLEELLVNHLEGVDFSSLPREEFEVTAWLVLMDDGTWKIDSDDYDNMEVIEALSGGLYTLLYDMYSEYYYATYFS